MVGGALAAPRVVPLVWVLVARKRTTYNRDSHMKVSVSAGLLLILSVGAILRAEPLPGDVFREYTWHDNGRWQRITGPDATMAGAKEFLPNKVNSIELTDLAGATRIEVQLELLQSHSGTIGQSIRLNGGTWIPIGLPAEIPGKAGSREGPPEMWLTMLHRFVEVPLAAVKPGANTFAPTGRVVAPTGVPGRFGTIELAVEPGPAPGRSIRRVDFLARYRGYDWRGEGVQTRWHYQTFFGELRRHAGTALAAPWKTAWDIRAVAGQDEPVQVAARISDDQGLCRITEAVTLEKFRGLPHTKLFAADQVPPTWQTRAGRRHSCRITLPDDLSGLREAKLVLASWNGDQAGTIGINDTVLVKNIGFNHDLSYDEINVPISALKPGENEFFTTSDTVHHGIEVLWPGVVLVARFAPPGAAH